MKPCRQFINLFSFYFHDELKNWETKLILLSPSWTIFWVNHFTYKVWQRLKKKPLNFFMKWHWRVRGMVGNVNSVQKNMRKHFSLNTNLLIITWNFISYVMWSFINNHFSKGICYWVACDLIFSDNSPSIFVANIMESLLIINL